MLGIVGVSMHQMMQMGINSKDGTQENRRKQQQHHARFGDTPWGKRFELSFQDMEITTRLMP